MASTKAQVTALICIGADGTALPPYILFLGKSVKSSYALDLPEGSRIYATDLGWMTQEASYFWISTVFIPSLPPKDERQFIMLLVDGHSSHKEFRTSKFCRQENIILFSLPPHTSHVLQPLDRGFFGPFKSYFRSECAAFTQRMQSAINRFSFGCVFSDAFRKTAQNELINKAFECSGIWPSNRDRINFAQQAPLKTFEREESPENENDTDISGSFPNFSDHVQHSQTPANFSSHSQDVAGSLLIYDEIVDSLPALSRQLSFLELL